MNESRSYQSTTLSGDYAEITPTHATKIKAGILATVKGRLHLESARRNFIVPPRSDIDVTLAKGTDTRELDSQPLYRLLQL